MNDDIGYWNIAGYERVWKRYPRVLDVLSPRSPLHHLKAFQTALYLDIMQPYLRRLAAGSVIADIAGGIGRFAIPLARAGYCVHLIDACKSNLKAAARHVRAAKLGNKIMLHGSDMRELPFPARTFGATLAIEAVCYCSNPEAAMAEIIRVTKPGGLVVISVENKYGSVLADNNISVGHLSAVCSQSELRIPNDTYTRYFTRPEFEQLLKRSGLKTLCVRGCQWTADGPLHRLVDVKKLSDARYRRQLAAVERLCAADPVLAELPRLWVGIARVLK